MRGPFPVHDPGRRRAPPNQTPKLTAARGLVSRGAKITEAGGGSLAHSFDYDANVSVKVEPTDDPYFATWVTPLLRT
jgi:hypothetical protein